MKPEINNTGVDAPTIQEKIAAKLNNATREIDTLPGIPEGSTVTNAAVSVKAAMAVKESQEEPPIVPLGQRGSGMATEYYVPRTGMSTSLRPTELRSDNLRALVALDALAAWICPECVQNDPEWGEKNEKKIMQEAKNRLLDMSREVGLYDPERLRKNGVWFEVVDGQPGYVYNAGDKCYFAPATGGKMREVSSNQAKHLYGKEVSTPMPKEKMLSAEEGLVLAGFLADRPWEAAHETCGMVLTGWIINSILSGIARRRPHLWITGPAGVGKTILHNDVLSILGFRSDGGNGLGVALEGATTSAAGARQKIDSRAVPVIFDELESNGDPRAKATIEEILKLMRTSFSSQTANFAKGGQDGKAIDYMVRSGFLCFSVHSQLDKETDFSRCLELRLQQLSMEERDQIWAKQEPGRKLIMEEDFTGRLIYTVLQRAQVIQRFEEELEEHLKNTSDIAADARRAELFAHLLAGYFALVKEGGELDAADLEKAVDCVQAYAATEDVSSEFDECLAMLLGHTEFVSGQQRSVGQLIQVAWRAMVKRVVSTDPRIYDYEYAAEAALDALGVSWVMRKRQPYLRLFPYNKTLNNKAFGGTRWKDKLRRVLGANCKEDGLPNEQGVMLSSARDGGQPKKALFLPEELFIADPDALWKAIRAESERKIKK